MRVWNVVQLTDQGSARGRWLRISGIRVRWWWWGRRQSCRLGVVLLRLVVVMWPRLDLRPQRLDPRRRMINGGSTTSELVVVVSWPRSVFRQRFDLESVGRYLVVFGMGIFVDAEVFQKLRQ